MQAYYDMMKERERDDALESAKKAALAAGEWGTVYGSLASLLSGSTRTVPGVLLRGVGAGAAAAGLGGSATYVGRSLLGEPHPGDPTAGTRQGALGGSLIGGGAGAGLGYLLGAGKLNPLANLHVSGQVAKLGNKFLPLDNLIVDRLKEQMAKPSHHGGLRTALALGALGAVVGGLHGAETGMDQDFMRNLDEDDQ